MMTKTNTLPKIFAAIMLVTSCSQVATEEPVMPVEREITEHIGVVSIVDGDTIDIRANRYRFDGIDTPERGAHCGNVNVYQKASLALADMVGQRNVECVPNGKKNGNRLIATCFVLLPNNGRENISETLVSMGWARDWPRYSGGKFANLEARARETGEGIWGLECDDDLWGNRNYE